MLKVEHSEIFLVLGYWVFSSFFAKLITKIYPLKFDPTNYSNSPKQFMGNISNELFEPVGFPTRVALVEGKF